MDVLKFEPRTFELLQVMDVLAVAEMKLIPQERVQQPVDCMEVVQCELEPERISERTVEQMDVLFVSQVRKTMELADIPVLQVVEEPVFSQVRVPHRVVEKNIVSQERQPSGIAGQGSTQVPIPVPPMTEQLVVVPKIVFHDRIQRWLPSKLSTCQVLRVFSSVVLSKSFENPVDETSS